MADGCTDPFHMGCPYTSLPICYCSNYCPPVPNYARAAPPPATSDTAALLADILRAACAPPRLDAPAAPSTHAVLAARAAADAPPAPEEVIRGVLARAAHAAPPPLVGGAFGGAAPAAPSGAGVARTEQMLVTEWKQAHAAQADMTARAKKKAAKGKRG